jgi:hypothetical protein
MPRKVGKKTIIFFNTLPMAGKKFSTLSGFIGSRIYGETFDHLSIWLTYHPIWI